MKHPGRPAGSRADAGYTLMELLISVAIIGMVASLALPMYAHAVREGRSTALQAEGKALYSALMRYYEDHSAFPSEKELDTTTLAPLTTDGYLVSGEAITAKLDGGALFVYLAPDVGGADQQFVAVMRLANDPTVIVGIVHTNLVTGDGKWADGSYVIDQKDLDGAGL